MAEKTLDQFTPATAKPTLAALLFMRQASLSAPQSRRVSMQLLMQTIQDGLAVESMAVSDPTALSPTEGQQWVVLATGAGGWSGKDNNIATWDGSQWLFAAPVEGWIVYDKNLNQTRRYNGTAWAMPAAPAYTVAGVPSASVNVRGIIYVSDEAGGATLAFSDGTNWRRVQDRAVVT